MRGALLSGGARGAPFGRAQTPGEDGCQRRRALTWTPCPAPHGSHSSVSRKADLNHSMVGVGRDLWGSSGPTPCQSRVTQSRLHRTRRGLNISREGDSTTPPGNLVQCSITLRVKKFFLVFRFEPEGLGWQSLTLPCAIPAPGGAGGRARQSGCPSLRRGSGQPGGSERCGEGSRGPVP